jgi:deazaflavin-dependent oxidoreductase (nitroreductase family)
VIVIGSNAGNLNEPGWSHNLKANPDAEIEIRGKRRRVRARVAEGDERAELWRRMNEQYAGFDDYERRTSRNIAVFVLERAAQSDAGGPRRARPLGRAPRFVSPSASLRACACSHAASPKWSTPPRRFRGAARSFASPPSTRCSERP